MLDGLNYLWWALALNSDVIWNVDVMVIIDIASMTQVSNGHGKADRYNMCLPSRFFWYNGCWCLQLCHSMVWNMSHDAWGERLRHALLQSQFQQSGHDPSMFCVIPLKETILLVYVNDIIIIDKDSKFLTTFINYNTFFMRLFAWRVGPLDYILGREDHKTAKGLFINQY